MLLVAQGAKRSLTESSRASWEVHLLGIPIGTLIPNMEGGFVLLLLPQVRFCRERAALTKAQSSLLPSLGSICRVSTLEMGQLHHQGNFQQEPKVLKYPSHYRGGLEADLVGLDFNFTECH